MGTTAHARYHLKLRGQAQRGRAGRCEAAFTDTARSRCSAPQPLNASTPRVGEETIEHVLQVPPGGRTNENLLFESFSKTLQQLKRDAHAAIDREAFAGNERRLFAGKEKGGFGNILRVYETVHGRAV